MATYNSLQYANGPKSFNGAFPGNTVAFYFEASPSAALTTSDTVNMGMVPKGFRLISATLEATDMDSGSTITLNVGDSGSATRIFSASTVAQTGTISNTQTTTGHGYKYTDDTLITIVPAAGPATTTGTLYLTLIGRVEGGAS